MGKPIKFILTTGLLLCGFFVHAQGVTKSVLFLGNSYTGSNNLPNLIANIADSKGDSLNYQSIAPGGFTLNGHTGNTGSLNAIATGGWDRVVLQEQSQMPSFPPNQVATGTLPYAAELCDSIYAANNCGKPMFFMTWGRKNGDALNCPIYPPVCTYAGMQRRLRSSYLLMAQNDSAEVAPVGAAWRDFRAAYPSVNLYTPDESHPSMAGSYLASCVFYASVFHQNPVGGWKPSNLDSLTAWRIQDMANKTVFDSLSVWGIDTAAYAVSYQDSLFAVPGGNNEFFHQLSFQGAVDSFLINYGSSYVKDTANCVLTNAPLNSTGQNWFWITFYHGCDSVTYLDSAYMGMGIGEGAARLELYPNPSSMSTLQLHSSIALDGAPYQVYNTNGEIVYSGVLQEDYLALGTLPAGVYILEVKANGVLLRRRFVRL